MNGAILTNRSAIDRSKTDFYETPVEVTEALLDFLEDRFYLFRGQTRIWEPACGDGKMARVMEERGYIVTGTDLHQMKYGEGGVDFLTADRECDWIITNPPFSMAAKFIEHAKETGKPCAMLLKSQFWHAKSRVQLFNDYPPSYVLPLTWRPDFLNGEKGGAPTMECIWTVWTGGGWPQYIPLVKPNE